ncbi:retropepsin-like aspartic protease [Paraburkholderia megapolitana]|uniref:Aspartyl protease n=1 Tax=Paraburkholderia megapolitana TaxID=420953 RepID=A0A1I3KWN5_9BURK|nr:retropepsin-like aspartic protease [Paraburkholderia megapolitana]SFI76834.1 Aspartyl protease [Paraburkholderia megapolitana]
MQRILAIGACSTDKSKSHRSSADVFFDATALRRALRHLLLSTVVWSGICVNAGAQMVETHPDPTCQLTKNAEIQMTVRGGHFIVPVDIGGHSYPMVLGTDTDRTALTPDAIRTLALVEDSRQANVVNGLAGSASEYPYTVPSLKFGPSEWVNLSVLAINMPKGASIDAEQPIGILGADVLSRYDLDVDFPNRTMTLYTAQECIAQFLPWKGRYFEYAAQPQSSSKHRFVIPATLNGQSIHGLLSTGSVRTLVKRSILAKIGGIRVAQLTFAPSSTGNSQSANVVDVYRFDSLQIGPRNYRNVRLRISDSIPDSEDIVLGLDFLRSRRVWFSHSSGRVFMQPSDDQEKVEIPGEIIQPGVFGSIKPDAESPDDLVTMLKNHPELSTHSHMTYYPSVRVVERTRLQPPP